MFSFYKKKRNMNERLDALHQKLTDLSIQSMGPTALFGYARNQAQIQAVITLITDFFALDQEITTGQMHSNDIAELKDLNFFDSDDPQGIDAQIAICLHSFPETAQLKALRYLNSIKLLYQEAVSKLMETLDEYAQAHNL